MIVYVKYEMLKSSNDNRVVRLLTKRGDLNDFFT